MNEKLSNLLNEGVYEIREQRLQKLREEFETALIHDGWPLDGWSADYVVSVKNGWFLDVSLIEAARRYIIARDFNVWEDGKWQMVWKLQNGGFL